MRKISARSVWLMACLLSCWTLISCKGGETTSDNSDTEIERFLKDTEWSATTSETAEDFFAFPVPASTALSLFIFSERGIHFFENQLPDDTGFESRVGIPQTVDSGYPTGLFFATEATRREIITYRSSNQNIELYAASRADATKAFEFTRSTLLASQSNNVTSMAVSPEGTSILLVSSSGNHRILKRTLDSRSRTQSMSVTVSSVGATVPTGVKALSADLNLSPDTEDDEPEDAEFLLVGTSDVRILLPQGDSLYTDSSALDRTGDGTILDAALFDLNADGKMDLLLLTDEGLEFYRNTSATNQAIAFRYERPTATGVSFSSATKMIVQDLTNDDKVDIVLLRGSSSPLILVQGEDKVFVNRTSQLFANQLASVFASEDIADALITDINADNLRDLIFVSDSGDIVTYLAEPAE